MQRLLIALGVLLLVAGLAWPWLSRLPWGRLPGDISIQRDDFSFHFPLMTSLIVSIVISLILAWWWWRK
jgi:Mg2+/citrate symporter